MIRINHAVSLGDTCQTTYRMRQQGLVPQTGMKASLPFDWSTTSHEALCKALNTRFEDVFSDGHVGVYCYKTGFRFGHHRICEMPNLLLKLEVLADRLWDIRDKSILFLRKVEKITSEEKMEIELALQNYGFTNFWLELASTEESNVSFPMRRPVEDWTGNTEDWGDWFGVLRTRYEFDPPTSLVKNLTIPLL